METGRQDGGSDKNHAPFSVGKTGNISRKFLTIILKIFDKNFERLHLGVVLNKVDLHEEGYYGKYGRYGKYGKYGKNAGKYSRYEAYGQYGNTKAEQ